MANIFVGSVHNLIRNLFLGLDGIIYGFINHVYWLFSMLTEVSIFSQDQIEAFAGRIYVLISIIMLFKLGFSFITYIVNPDSFTDKQKGGTALLKNIAIAIILLASVPTIFNEAMHLQQLIFKNNVIDKILLGNTVQVEDSYVNENGENVQVEQSNALSMYAFMAFFQPNYSISECNTYEGIAISDSCVSKLNELDKTGHNPGSAYKQAIETYNLDFITASDIANVKGKVSTSNSDAFYVSDESYLFEYKYGLSTIVGVFIVWILLGFCLDLAIRVVKLGFLQIIAPIPIILSITPGQKNNPLTNWSKESLSTWLSLFIRVLVISFALTTIQLINSGGGIVSFVTGGSNNYAMVTVFVMLGILLFAKEFPKLLEDILGLKGTGKMTFNAWKKLGSAPLLGGVATAGATLAGAGALALGRGAWGTTKSIGTGLGTGIGAAWRGEGFGTGFKDGFGRQIGDTGDRMKARSLAGLSSAKDKITSAGLGGTDKLGGSMHKAYKDKYSTDAKKSSDKLSEGTSLLNRTLTETIDSNGNVVRKIDDTKKYGIYKNEAFSDALRTMEDAKTRRNEAQSRYEQMKTQIDAGTENVQIRDNKGNVTATYSRDEAIAKLDNVRIDSVKASGDFDKIKADFDGNIKVKYKDDARRYEAFSAAADAFEARENVKKYKASSAANNGNLSNQPAGSIANALNNPASVSMNNVNNRPVILDQYGNPLNNNRNNGTGNNRQVPQNQNSMPSQGGSATTPQQPQRQNSDPFRESGFGPGNNNQ